MKKITSPNKFTVGEKIFKLPGRAVEYRVTPIGMSFADDEQVMVIGLGLGISRGGEILIMTTEPDSADS